MANWIWVVEVLDHGEWKFLTAAGTRDEAREEQRQAKYAQTRILKYSPAIEQPAELKPKKLTSREAEEEWFKPHAE
jgi:hypothetical protein